MALPFVYLIINGLSGGAVGTALVKWRCGDSYMIEPDKALRTQGILSEAACGFDADMIGVVILLGTFLLGFVLTILWSGKK